MKKLSKFLSAALALTMAVSSTAFGAVPSDVDQNAWYADAVNYVVEEGIMIGTAEDVFEPGGVVNLASLYQTFYNLSGSQVNPEDAAITVEEGIWYENAALWASAVGIHTDEEFDASKMLTKEEAAVSFITYAKTIGIDDLIVDLMLIQEELGLELSAPAIRAELAEFHYQFADYIFAAEEDGHVAVVDKYGNITLTLYGKNLYNAGYEPGDVLAVTIGDNVIEAPLCTSYSDVDTGELVVRIPSPSSNVIIAINMGNFAETYNVSEGDAVSFEIKEKGAYLDEYELRQLERSNDRNDYASDQIFANFREVTLGSIAEGTYYRSSSPINNEISRASYADSFAAAAGIQTVINLADTQEELEGYFAAEDFNSPYYKSLYDNGQVIYLGMGVDFTSEDFKAKLKTGLEFLIENEGPFLVHCNEGKDRAGYVAAVLSALMGATAEEIKEDYLVTYINYYGVEEGSEQYHRIGESNILESMRNIAGLEKGAELSGVDLAQAAENYLEGIGLSHEQVETLKGKLAGN